MRRLAVFCVDLTLIVTSTICAIILRDNLDVSFDHIVSAIPYLSFTLTFAILILPLLQLPQRMWRFSAMGDYLRLIAASTLIVTAAVAVTFAYNRLDGVARTLPFLQLNLMICLLVGGRVVRRLQHHKTPAVSTLPEMAHPSAESILIIGLNRLADLYIRSLTEFAPNRVHIAGILDAKAARHGNMVHQFPILGKPEHVERVIRDLVVHGVVVRKIVVAQRFSALSPIAQQALLQLEASSDVKLDFLSERLGFEGAPTTSKDSTSESATQRFAFTAAEIENVRARPIWRIKRFIDVVFASLALIVSAPLMLLAAVLVAIDVGAPISFWQQRPGRDGTPLTVYKFRTMRAAHNRHGRLIPEGERTSWIGRFIRRTRLDELPQLFSILSGDMSFVGPRPLLPKDQPAQYAARLIVRPGLTGWAQVNGGRDISAEDKAALDVWYVQNASLRLDLKIILRTIPMILFGERLRREDIQRAWLELRRDGIATHLPVDVTSDATVLSNRRAA